jgi:uncharacterized protein (TIGR02270 family)
MNMTAIPSVLRQHADEASFQWGLRRTAVAASHYSLADLAKLDGRVEAHLDGLRIAGEDGWKICEEQLAANEEGEVFAAGVLAFESGKPAAIAKVLSVVEQTPALAGSLASALGWLPFERAQPHIQALLKGQNPVQQRLGIAAAAIHRRHPGEALAGAARSEHPGLRARALKAVGELQDKKLSQAVTAAWGDADPECRFAAAWSGALLGLSGAVPVLQAIAESPSPHASRATGLAMRRMDAGSALAWQKRLAANPPHLRLAILAAGVIGDPALVPWLLPLTAQLPLSRVAGESFTFIMGVDLAYQDLERKPPEDFQAGPTEDPKDENVEMDPDENLPWPDPVLVAKWWEKNQGQFAKGTRHLCGRPVTADWLKQVLRDGYQRQRAAAALELCSPAIGQPLFNVSAPGFRQVGALGKPSSLR